MSMTRNQRRRVKARKDALALADAHNTALILERKAIRDANLSHAMVREPTCKISSVYSGSGSARAYGRGVSYGR